MWPTKLNVLLLIVTLVNTQLPQRYGYNDQVYFEDNRPTNDKNVNYRISASPLLLPNRENNGNIQNTRYQDTYNESKRKQFGQVRPVVPMMDKNNPLTINYSGGINEFGPEKTETFINQDSQQLINSTLAKATNGIVNLALLFLKYVDTMSSQNAVLSPFSIALSLGLLEQGAQAETQKEIASVLQMSPDLANASFRTFLNRTKGSSSNILDIATSIFADGAFSLNPTFSRMATESFKSDVVPLSFGNTVEAANFINNWVEDKTKHKIQKIISSESLRDSVIVLANAVYFKGKWQSKFSPEATIDKVFTLANGEKKNVPFMRLRRGFKIGYDQNLRAQILIMPFQNEEFNFMMILPDPNVRLDDVIAKLYVDKLLSYHQISMKEAHIEIPKFTIRSDTDLKAVLQKMGVTKVFSPHSELYGLGTANKQSPYISAAVHSSVLSIDESGGTAAAATAFAGVPLSADLNLVYFKANRPFLALIWHGELKIPLFTARIEDPTF